MFALVAGLGLGACAPTPTIHLVEPEAPFSIIVAPIQRASAEPSAGVVASADLEPASSADAESAAGVDVEPAMTTAPAKTQGGVPLVRMQSPTVGPSYPPELIKTVLRRSKPGIQKCTQHKPSTSSRGVLTFTIETDGGVKDAAYKDGDAALTPSPAQQCVLDAIRAMKFVRPRSRITVRYP